MSSKERTVLLPVSREALWRLLADTDRLNRVLNLPSVIYAFDARADGGSHLRGEARFGPLAVRYREDPYEWIRPERWSVRRFPENGPVRELSLSVCLTPDGDSKTRVTARAEVLGRGPTGSLTAGKIADSCVDGLLRAASEFARRIADARPVMPPDETIVVDRGRLARASDGARKLGADPAAMARLREWVENAPSMDVSSLRPHALADSWGLSRRAVLIACLHSVRAGLLELKWRILCPACRGAGESERSLADLSIGDAHCPSCDIRFGPEFDRNIEVLFCVAPSVRTPGNGDALFCRGGPMRAPHVLAQLYPRPGETRGPIERGPRGLLVARSPQSQQTLPLPENTGGWIEIGADNALGFTPGETSLDTIMIANNGSSDVLVCLEAPGWVDDAATAAEVTSLSAFRSHFGSEILSPGMEIAVRQATLLFTDLKGSTALYADRGDAPSYAAVRAHFAFLSERIERNGGGIVKTIGDAVMASFSDPADAFFAALEIQRDAPGALGGLVVKAGIHSGPALAVSENGVLDFFGHTVNVAARLQAHSLGGDIVCVETLLGDPKVARALEKAGNLAVRRENFVAELRGASGPIRLTRLTIL